MANVKWSAFPSGTTISGTDIAVGLQSGADVQWPFSALATYITGALTATGSGSFVRATSPTMVTPTLGAATATSVTGPSLFGGTAAGSSLTIASTSGSGTSDFIGFQTASQTERARFVTTGELIKGYTARVAVGAAGTTFPAIQNHGTTVATASENYRWSADTNGATLGLAKSRGAAIGTRGAVTAGDSLGSLIAHGDDGTNFISAAAIQALVDGTVSGGVVPGRLSFQTANSSGTVTEAMRITSAQLITFGGGVTTSFPALKRSSAVLQGRLADDSDFCQVQGKITTAANAVTGLTAGVLSALTTASIVIYDATGTAYRVPCITP